ncbi:FecR domain-containing protein [uncultured Herbaspirillum sp.]|uniref:FecR domain-containing protein n=1 Tax=uncultured Herbaspirillum sp. TaxID=160236 RepID=UPI00258DC5EE|nr:FecR domain-containing protein [uncultured Herbaspirillum sp.]
MKNEDKIVEQAIDWMLQIEQGELGAGQQIAFERWKAADPRHATAYANLTQSVQQFDIPRQVGAAPDILRNTLQQKSRRRKTLKQIAALAGLAVGAGALLNRITPLEGLSADLHTGTGERQRSVLADGSIVTLNARSAIDHQILPGSRQIRLLAGEMQLQVAAHGALPFSVDTVHGSASLMDGTLMLALQPLRTDLVALQAAQVLVTTRNNTRGALAGGQHSWFDSDSIGTPRANAGGEASWVDGYYTASNSSLAEVVAALRPYRKGIVRLDPAVAELRISGAFPLDDTDRALSALASALPITVSRVSPYWVTISSRA